MDDQENKAVSTANDTPDKQDRSGMWKRRLFIVALAVMALTVSAFATGDTTTPETGMTKVVASLDMIYTMCQSVWSLMTNNPYLALSLGVGLLGTGFRIFRRARRTAH